MRRYRSNSSEHRKERLASLGFRIPLVALIQTVAVAEHLNFHRAARTLGVSQSSVSSRIRALEIELGVLLFERSTRGVRLTEAGRLFVERITAGIDQLDYAVKNACMAASGESGRLRIAVPGLIVGSFLHNLLTTFRRRYPRLMLEMIETTSRDAITQVRARRIDVAFVVGDFELPDCHSRPIWTEAMMAALPADHRLADQPSVTWASLAADQFLVRHGGSGPQLHDHIVMRFAGRWSQPVIRRLEVERSTLLSMVAQGFGITLLSAASGHFPTAGVVLLPIADEPEPVIFSAVWSPHERSAALGNLFALSDDLSRENPPNHRR